MLIAAPGVLVLAFIGAAALSAGGGSGAEPVRTVPSAEAETAAPSSLPSAEAAKNDKAPGGELSEATAQGREALAALAEKYPKDPAIPLAQSAIELKQKDPVRAVEAVRRALALDAGLVNDGQVASVLWVAAQSAKSSEQAFQVLKGPMGAKGRSILNDLASTPNVRDAVRAEARRALAEPAAQ